MSQESQAKAIVDALGGFSNINELESCITRLRLEVKDPKKVDQEALKAAGAHGVVGVGTTVQVIVGPDSDDLAKAIEGLQ